MQGLSTHPIPPQRLIYGLFLLFITLRYWQNAWLFQLQQPFYTSPSSDNLQWLLHLANIPQLLVKNQPVSLIFSLLLVFCNLFLLYKPYHRVGSWLFAGLFSLYFFGYNSANLHHGHQLIVLWFFSIVLLFKSEPNYLRGLQFLRYYGCFILCSAACWKIGRGSWLHISQLSHILPVQHLQFIHENPEHFYTQIIRFLCGQIWLSYGLWLSAIGLQLFFAVGFFTRRWDNWLRRLLVGFLLMDLLLMRLYFLEMLVLLSVFWKEENKTEQAQKKDLNP